jgi:uncharacterized protein YecA (UPF0149 family)
MPFVPAICSNCQLIFPSGFGSLGTIHATFVGCSAGPCPKCGGVGTILDGVYHSVGDTVSLISHNADQLRRLAEVVRLAQRSQQTYAEIEKKFDEVAPGLGKFLPKNPTELQGYLKLLGPVLITIASLIAANKFDATNVPSHIDKATQSIYDELEPKAQKRPTAKSVGRNEPCPCGSGKKYKTLFQNRY